MRTPIPPIASLGVKRCLIPTLVIAFLLNGLGPIPAANADEFRLPAPGVMVRLSPPLDPPILKGIKVNPNNPFQFQFILDKGDSNLSNDALKGESDKLIKYFLAALTIPDKDLWVNLSPYEKDRIIPNSFGLTEMGRDLLAEDYLLKQITASLIYPEDVVGKKFWKRIYQEAAKRYGTTNIPVNTFNKVWIVPQKAVVFENAKEGAAYVVESKLKVMMEQDYLSMEKHVALNGPGPLSSRDQVRSEKTNALGSQIIREIVLPELTTEVNENKNFAALRQVYNSLILAVWYRTKIRDSILSQVYSNKNKVAGVNISDPQEKEKIYQRYLKAFKKGVYNYIKEDVDPVSQEVVPRKYFSGGVNFEMTSGRTNLDSNLTIIDSRTASRAMITSFLEKNFKVGLVVVMAALNLSLSTAPLKKIPHRHTIAAVVTHPSTAVSSISAVVHHLSFGNVINQPSAKAALLDKMKHLGNPQNVTPNDMNQFLDLVYAATVEGKLTEDDISTNMSFVVNYRDIVFSNQPAVTKVISILEYLGVNGNTDVANQSSGYLSIVPWLASEDIKVNVTQEVVKAQQNILVGKQEKMMRLAGSKLMVDEDDLDAFFQGQADNQTEIWTEGEFKSFQWVLGILNQNEETLNECKMSIRMVFEQNGHKPISIERFFDAIKKVPAVVSSGLKWNNDGQFFTLRQMDEAGKDINESRLILMDIRNLNTTKEPPTTPALKILFLLMGIPAAIQLLMMDAEHEKIIELKKKIPTKQEKPRRAEYKLPQDVPEEAQRIIGVLKSLRSEKEIGAESSLNHKEEIANAKHLIESMDPVKNRHLINELQIAMDELNYVDSIYQFIPEVIGAERIFQKLRDIEVYNDEAKKWLMGDEQKDEPGALSRLIALAELNQKLKRAESKVKGRDIVKRFQGVLEPARQFVDAFDKVVHTMDEYRIDVWAKKNVTGVFEASVLPQVKAIVRARTSKEETSIRLYQNQVLNFQEKIREEIGHGAHAQSFGKGLIGMSFNFLKGIKIDYQDKLNEYQSIYEKNLKHAAYLSQLAEKKGSEYTDYYNNKIFDLLEREGTLIKEKQIDFEEKQILKVAFWKKSLSVVKGLFQTSSGSSLNYKPLMVGALPVNYAMNVPVGFRTSRGSTYTILPSPYRDYGEFRGEDFISTQRIKSPHTGHLKGDVGKKEVSAATYFVRNALDARRIAMHASLNVPIGFYKKGDILLLVDWNQKKRKWGMTEYDRQNPIRLSNMPAKGYYPIEFFKPGVEKNFNVVIFQGVHAGNEIIEITDNTTNVKKTTGGIDLTAQNMNLKTLNAGQGIKFYTNPAMLRQLENAPGFTPVVINIHPLDSLPKFLGLSDTEGLAVSS